MTTQISRPGDPNVTDHCGKTRTVKRGQSHGTRLWSQITGITLHQTAVDFGSPEHGKILVVPSHTMTFQDGQVALLNSPELIMWHGNKLNKTDIGIEVSCHAAGIEGNLGTFRAPKKKQDMLPLEATDAQLESTFWAVRYYCDLVAEHGGKILYIHAHRQGTDTRTSDPGSRIWQHVALRAEGELGLTSGPRPGWTIGRGQPIPTAWDPRVKGTPYSWRVKGY